jgi:ribose 5-phosphate isomerase A
MASDEGKRRSGEKAAEYVQDGSIVGVGTGSTVAFFIEALARMKSRIEGAVSSSEQSTKLLQGHGIPCSTSTRPGRCRCTWTAPTSAIRSGA